ncbi:MAG: OmpH family outer membrane protein [Phycisphaerae bacterium]|nr:OmpH family outer membrane protein [Phycisphaerae bacterium]
MKSKTMMTIGCGVGLLVLMFNLGINAQQAGPVDQLQRVGVVSVMSVIQNSQANAKHIAALNVEQDKMIREQTKEEDDLQAEAKVLNTMINGTDDFFKQKLKVFNKQAALQAKTEYNKQYLQAKDMKWRSQLYKNILAAVSKVAEAKGLTMVFERTEPAFPIPSEGFAVTVSTHKLIYSKGCVDMTADVIAEIDQ